MRSYDEEPYRPLRAAGYQEEKLQQFSEIREHEKQKEGPVSSHQNQLAISFDAESALIHSGSFI